MTTLEFSEATKIKRGATVEVRLHGEARTRVGTLMGHLPADPSKRSNRERQAAIVVRSGAVIEHLREDDVCTIKVDGRKVEA